MKNLFFIIFLFSIFVGKNIEAQTKFSKDEITSALKTIFELSKKQDYKALATHFVYKEKDEFKTYDYNDISEAKIVKRLAKKIKAYLDLSDSYVFDNFSIGKKEKLGNINLNVLFESNNQKLKITFVLVDNAGILLLADFK